MTKKIKPTLKMQICPCCDQTVKIYRRKVHVTMANELFNAYSRYGVGTPFKVKDLGKGYGGGEFAKLTFWDLVVRPVKKDGHWMVTPRGEKFLKGKLSIPKYAHIYNGNLLTFAGKQVTISDILDKPELFDRKEI